MSHLTARERELVSLGAAMGSNCVSCIEYHIPASRRAGLSDTQISEAIRLADKLRQVAARKTLDVAVRLLADTIAPASLARAAACGVLSPPASRRTCSPGPPSSEPDPVISIGGPGSESAMGGAPPPAP